MFKLIRLLRLRKEIKSLLRMLSHTQWDSLTEQEVNDKFNLIVKRASSILKQINIGIKKRLK